MRILILLCLVLCLFSFSPGQIPNSGFENWADDGSGNINPVGWETTNGSPYVSVDSVKPGHSGTYAMRVRTIDIGGMNFAGAAFLGLPFTFTETPTRFGAWVKSTIMPGDTALLIVGLTKGEEVIAATDSCTFKIFTSYSQYTYLEFPIRIESQNTPDSMYIMVATGLTPSPQLGTELIVDDLAFGTGPTSVASQNQSLPAAFALTQNYPNPFNASANFGLRIADLAHVELRIFDLLGREVATLMNEQKSPGTYQVRWDSGTAPSGVYLVRMRAGGFTEVRKIMLVK